MKPIQWDLTGIHVLLVDDNDDALEIFGNYLRHVGALVTVARNGAEALGYLGQARAHVIVTDLSMPGMDGVEFVTRLRGYHAPDNAMPPVVAVTAFPREYSEEQMADLGFRSYLVKPVDPTRLAAEVRRVYEYAYGPEGGTATPPDSHA